MIVIDSHPPRPRPPVEIVERKGLGHPDTICDALAEEAGRALSRAYLDRFGAVLHYNVDKALLIGGTATPAFGGGEVGDPIEVILAGRATRQGLDVEGIAEAACRDWLRTTLPIVAPHVRVRCRLREGSTDLAHLYGRRRARSNDTSAGVGYAPLSPVERAVLAVERALTEPSARRWAGPDVKVMAVRNRDAVRITVSCALIGRHIADIDAYLARREELRVVARDVAAAVLGAPPEVLVNAADDPEAGSVYLTVTGTSAEAGDDGEVGRGNRVNGLITPLRPMSMEAWAGKNVVSHVGRLYNALAAELAADFVEAGALEAECALVGEIGRPVDDPAIVAVSLYGGYVADAHGIVAARLGQYTPGTNRGTRRA